MWSLEKPGVISRTGYTVSTVMSSAVASAAPTAVVKAPPQGGVLEGVNPVHFDAKNPIILFIVQVCFVLVMS